MASLVRIGDRTGSESVGDVVFVHGLSGHPRSTWEFDADGFKEFWPQNLADDLPLANVWSLGYEAAVSDWFGSSMALTDRARNVLDYLDADEIGKKPIVFIAHSLGGLVVKQLLRVSKDFGLDHECYNVYQNTKGVVFFATPHAGSRLSSYLGLLRGVARASKASMDLRFDDAHLNDLNQWFRGDFRSNRIRLVIQERCTRAGLESHSAISQM